MKSLNSFPCGRYRSEPVSRREMLARCAGGFGAVALAALTCDQAFALEETDLPLQGKAGHGPHHPPRATNVIFLYMDGGPSQVDTFDPKPMLDKYHGQDPARLFGVEPTQFNNNGSVLASPWKFKQHGESGIPVSSLFPHVAGCVDELAVIRSMVSEFPEHTFANYFLHTGSGFQGRPSMGAWVNYGLGSECQNLPGFVAVNGGLIPPGGLDCFGSGFLPACYQGSVFKPSGMAVANIERTESTSRQQKSKLELVDQLDKLAVNHFGRHDSLESAIKNYELAYDMQMAVPELMSLDDESADTLSMYGMDSTYQPTQDLRGRVFARTSLDRAWGAIRRVDLSPGGWRSLGSAQQPETGPREQRPCGGSADCGTVDGPASAWLARQDVGSLGR